MLIILTKSQFSDQLTKSQNFAIIISAKSQSEISATDTFILIEQNNLTAIQFSFSEITKIKDIQFVLNKKIIYIINLRQLR